MPNPSSDSTPYCRARSSPASGASNSQSSRSVTSASLRDAGNRAREPDATRISRGVRRAINGSRSASVVSINRTSPVETSAAATPTRASDVGASRSAATRIAQMKLFRAPSSRSSANATPGRHRLDDFAPHYSFRDLRILDLLADGDAKALLHEAAHVVAGGFHRNARQRNVGGAAVVARRQRQPEDARRRFGVVVKHLVELAHAKKQDRVLMPTLDLAILLHERRLRGRRHRRHLSSEPISVTNAVIFFALSCACAAIAAARVS